MRLYISRILFGGYCSDRERNRARLHGIRTSDVVSVVAHCTTTVVGWTRFVQSYETRAQYKPAPCGIDSNLLLLLHGLGDTADPFFSLGQRLQQTLPQTAVLSVQAPLRVPLLEEEAWMWYDSFDALGEGTFACPSVQDKSVSCCRMTPGIVSCLPTAFVPHATYTLARTIRLFWPNFTNGTQCA